MMSQFFFAQLFHRAIFACCRAITALLLIAGIISNSHAASYVINPEHTNVRFSVDTFHTSNSSTVTGGFYNVTGQLQYDPSVNRGKVTLMIPINSLKTGSRALDMKLTGVDFFEIERFPQAYFESTKWYFAPDKAREVTRVDGNLTLHGKTHLITLTATKFHCYDSPVRKNSTCSGDFTTTIDRTKWNINKYLLLGFTKYLTLDIKVEASTP